MASPMDLVLRSSPGAWASYQWPLLQKKKKSGSPCHSNHQHPIAPKKNIKMERRYVTERPRAIGKREWIWIWSSHCILYMIFKAHIKIKLSIDIYFIVWELLSMHFGGVGESAVVPSQVTLCWWNNSSFLTLTYSTLQSSSLDQSNSMLNKNAKKERTLAIASSHKQAATMCQQGRKHKVIKICITRDTC